MWQTTLGPVDVITTGGRSLSFIHASFQEYCAEMYMVENEAALSKVLNEWRGGPEPTELFVRYRNAVGIDYNVFSKVPCQCLCPNVGYVNLPSCLIDLSIESRLLHECENEDTRLQFLERLKTAAVDASPRALSYFPDINIAAYETLVSGLGYSGCLEIVSHVYPERNEDNSYLIVLPIDGNHSDDDSDDEADNDSDNNAERHKDIADLSDVGASDQHEDNTNLSDVGASDQHEDNTNLSDVDASDQHEDNTNLSDVGASDQHKDIADLSDVGASDQHEDNTNLSDVGASDQHEDNTNLYDVGASDRHEYNSNLRDVGGSDRHEYNSNLRDVGGSDRHEYNSNLSDVGASDRHEYNSNLRDVGGSDRHEYNSNLRDVDTSKRHEDNVDINDGADFTDVDASERNGDIAVSDAASFRYVGASDQDKDNTDLNADADLVMLAPLSAMKTILDGGPFFQSTSVQSEMNAILTLLSCIQLVINMMMTLTLSEIKTAATWSSFLYLTENISCVLWIHWYCLYFTISHSHTSNTSI